MEGDFVLDRLGSERFTAEGGLPLNGIRSEQVPAVERTYSATT